MALEFDFAPVWLPDDEFVTEEQAAAQPADRVEGWTWSSLFVTAVVGSRSKTASRVGAILAVIIFATTFPTLARNNFFELARLGVIQILATGALLAATRRVRSISVGTVAVHWLAGCFLAPLLVQMIDALVGLIPGTDGAVLDWLRPVLALLVPTAVLILAIVRGSQRWTHPGVGDLVVLGYVVGAGFTFHEDGLLDQDLGTQLTGSAAYWLTLLGFALGLAALHRPNRFALTLAAFVAAVVVGDALVFRLGWLPVLMAVAAVAGAVVADRERLGLVQTRDHLFPDAPDRHHDLLVGRYRRLRNGVHTTLGQRGEQWPPVTGGPVAELARAGRAASVEVGRQTGNAGWDRDPDDRSGAARRFFGPNGWTPFTVGDGGPRVATPRSRPDARPRDPERATASPRWQTNHHALWTAGAVIVLCGLGFLTTDLDNMGNATLAAASSPTVRTTLGGLVTAAALFGSARPLLGEAWELGPPDHHEA
ncbi:MAG: hypothetical protein AAF567_23595 [Actinomycetota bacterium]